MDVNQTYCDENFIINNILNDYIIHFKLMPYQLYLNLKKMKFLSY